MKTYNFTDYEYTDNFIQLLPNTILYRGITSDKTLSEKEIIRDRPMYLGTKVIAEKYGKIYCLNTKTSIQLLDLRKIMHLLSFIMDYTDDYTGNMFLMIAYGLVPYNIQLQLFEKLNNKMLSIGRITQSLLDELNKIINRMKTFNFDNVPNNPVLTRGVRIGEPFIDMQCLLIIKELFKHVCDGYIVPALISPYHNGNIAHEEIVIFDPVEYLELADPKYLDLPLTPIQDLLYISCIPVILRPNLQILLPKSGGHKDKTKDKNKINSKMYKASVEFAKNYVSSLKVDITSKIANCGKPHKAYYIQ